MSIVYHDVRSVPWSNAAQKGFAIGFGLLLIGSAVTVAMYWRRRAHQCIAARGPTLTVIQAASGVLATFALIDYRLIRNLPCFVNLWLLNICMCTWLTCVLMRAIFLYVNYRFQQAKLLGVFTVEPDCAATQSRRKANDPELDASSQLADELAKELTAGGASSSTSSSRELAPLPDEVESLSNGCVGALDRRTDAWLCRRKKAFTERTMILGLVPAMAVFVTWVIVAQCITRSYRIYPYMDVGWCTFELQIYGLVYALIFVDFYVLAPFFLWGLYGVKDSHKISLELSINIGCGIILTSLYMLIMFKFVPSSLQEAVPITLYLLSHGTSIILPLVKSYSDEAKLKRETLMLNLDSFKKVIESDTLLSSFKKFNAAELSVENVLFWEAHKELMHQTDRSVRRIQRMRRVGAILDSTGGSLESIVGDIASPNANRTATLPISHPIASSRVTTIPIPVPLSSSRSQDARNAGGVGLSAGLMSTVPEGRSSQEIDIKSIASVADASDENCPTKELTAPESGDNNAASMSSAEGDNATAPGPCATATKSPSLTGSELRFTPSGPTSARHSLRQAFFPSAQAASAAPTSIRRSVTLLHRLGASNSGGRGSTVMASQALSVSSAWVDDNPGRVPPDMRRRFTSFYNHYVCEGAIHEVNLPFDMRDQLKGRAMQADWMISDFDQAKEYVVINMFWNVYPRWLAHRREQEEIKARAGWMARLMRKFRSRNHVENATPA
ncbi:hypothetical protein HK101_010446 [Irineochytrium annulatum]|nr:hypothetical protein HK101_010446 [Irineochytrium annulatum]